MISRLLRSVEVNLWIPPTSQFFDGRDVNGSVVKERAELRHIPIDEVAVHTD